MMSIDQFTESSRKIFELGGYELGPKCCAGAATSAILTLALFIIGCVAASYTPTGIGYTTIALATGIMLANLVTGNLEGRATYLLVSAFVTAALITFGALGASSILTANQVGWGILGTYAVEILVGCGLSAKKMADFLAI